MRRIRPKPAPRDDEDSLDTSHIAVRTMFRKGEITESSYFKVLVHLANSWLVLERREDAVSLVCELTPEYVRYTLPQQMEDDPAFRQEALAVARALSEKLPDLDEDDVKLTLMLLERPVAKA